MPNKNILVSGSTQLRPLMNELSRANPVFMADFDASNPAKFRERISRMGRGSIDLLIHRHLEIPNGDFNERNPEALRAVQNAREELQRILSSGAAALLVPSPTILEVNTHDAIHPRAGLGTYAAACRAGAEGARKIATEHPEYRLKIAYLGYHEATGNIGTDTVKKILELLASDKEHRMLFEETGLYHLV